MLQAAKALTWKNNGILVAFGLRVADPREGENPKSMLEAFFDQAQLCAAAPWWGWGWIVPDGVVSANPKWDRPLHMVFFHPEAHHIDFVYCPMGAAWGVRLRAIPFDVGQQNMIEHGIAAVRDDMRRALSGFNKLFGGTEQNGSVRVAPAENGHAKRRLPGRQAKPNRARRAPRR